MRENNVLYINYVLIVWLTINLVFKPFYCCRNKSSASKDKAKSVDESKPNEPPKKNPMQAIAKIRQPRQGFVNSWKT